MISPRPSPETKRSFVVLVFIPSILLSGVPPADCRQRRNPKGIPWLAEKDRAGARTMNLYVARSTVSILRVLIVLRAGRLHGANIVRDAMAGQAELVHRAVTQQPRIGGSVRRMTRRAAFGFHRRVLIQERSLLVSMALDTGGVGSGRLPALLLFKAAMRIVTIAATHGAFQHLMVMRRRELGLHFVMATHAQLRIAQLEHPDG